jgi:hypothetical protein
LLVPVCSKSTEIPISGESQAGRLNMLLTVLRNITCFVAWPYQLNDIFFVSSCAIATNALHNCSNSPALPSRTLVFTAPMSRRASHPTQKLVCRYSCMNPILYAKPTHISALNMISIHPSLYYLDHCPVRLFSWQMGQYGRGNQYINAHAAEVRSGAHR